MFNRKRKALKKGETENMAIRWEWKDKIGEAIIERTFDGESKEHTVSLYQGNCYLIFINEWTEDGVDKYSLYTFFADKKHMEVCLGIERNRDGDYDNMFDNGIDTLKKVKLSRKCRDLSDIVITFLKAFKDIDIEVYNEEK